MSDCIVVGGGIIGMLTARELARAGMRITLFERSRSGREASWAGGGIISPLYPWRYSEPVTALARWSQIEYPKLAATLHEETGIDPEYTRSGLLILDDEEHSWAEEWGQEQEVPLEIIDARSIGDYEPALASPPPAGIRMPQVAQVRNPRFVRALRAAIDGQVEVREDTEVEHLLIENGRVVGVQSAAGRCLCNTVVIRDGALPHVTLDELAAHADFGDVALAASRLPDYRGTSWTRNLLAGLGAALEIEPVRGQMILYRAEPDTVSRIVLNRDHYVIPRRDGRVLVGSTLENTGFQKETTDQARKELERYAREMLPGLAGFPVEHHWAGLRPSSPRGVPFIGRFPGTSGLFLNSGHFRNGVVLAPASARLLADMLLERKPILPGEPYAIDAARG